VAIVPRRQVVRLNPNLLRRTERCASRGRALCRCRARAPPPFEPFATVCAAAAQESSDQQPAAHALSAPARTGGGVSQPQCGSADITQAVCVARQIAMPTPIACATSPIEQLSTGSAAATQEPSNQRPARHVPSAPARTGGGVPLPRFDSTDITRAVCVAGQSAMPMPSAGATLSCEQSATVCAAVARVSSDQQQPRTLPVHQRARGGGVSRSPSAVQLTSRKRCASLGKSPCQGRARVPPYRASSGQLCVLLQRRNQPVGGQPNSRRSVTAAYC
jgi:hypothetical protein